MYSITDKHSFFELQKIMKMIQQFRSTYPPCVVVANKMDLRHRRQVSFSEGEQFAHQHGFAFFELSAAAQINNVRSAFMELYREIRRRKNVRRKSSSNQMKLMINKVFNRKKLSSPASPEKTFK